MAEKRRRKPYNGRGVTVPAVTPATLPPEPSGEHPIVQVEAVHHLYGLRPVFQRMFTGWIPRGWIPASAYSWRDLCRMGGGQAPTVLEVTP